MIVTNRSGLLFDLDGTLVEAFTTTPLPGVPNFLQRMQAKGAQIGIATNQAGPGWRALTGNEKYPGVEQLTQSLLTIADTLGLNEGPWFIAVGGDPRLLTLGKSAEEVDDIIYGIQQDLLKALRPTLPFVHVFADPCFRKPNPGLLWKAAVEWMIIPPDLCSIGDMETDREAAQNANIPFIHATDMFVEIEA